LGLLLSIIVIGSIGLVIATYYMQYWYSYIAKWLTFQ
jgi:hypothetical protein